MATRLTESASNEESLQAKFEESLKKIGSKLTVLCIGPIGVGKSTLLNGVMGEKIFEVGERLERGTTEVERHTFTKNGITMTLWDTPGLEGSQNDEKYLKEIKEKCPNPDVFLYCIDSSETKAGELTGEKSSLVEFTQLFGVELWDRAVVALVLANVIEADLKEQKEIDASLNIDKLFEDRICEWKKKTGEMLEKSGVPKRNVEAVPVIPAGTAVSPNLPGHSLWLNNLKWEFAKRLASFKDQLAYIKMLQGRLRYGDVNTEEISKQNIEDQPFILESDSGSDLPFWLSGLGGGAGGAGVGAGVGALIGGLAGGIPTAGLGAIPGVAIGAAVGGAVGGFVGSGSALAVAFAWKLFRLRN